MQAPAPWHHSVASNQCICMTLKIKMARKRSHLLQKEWQLQEGHDHEVETPEAGQWRRGGWMSNVA